MNRSSTLLKALLLVCVLHCSTLLHTPSFLAGIDVHDITRIEIHYSTDAHIPSPARYEFYEINRINDIYCSNTGKEVSLYFIKLLLSSLTDLYESDVYEDRYDGFFMTSYYPHFKVIIALNDETQIILKSDSNYHCWIPWNVECNGKTYVQYNGEIPSALLKILVYLDSIWSYNEKLITWGCYPAPVPERYKEKGISKDFPASTHVETPEEIIGRTHLMWKVSIESSIIISPEFLDNTVVVAAWNKVVLLDSQTGDILWEKHLNTLTGNLVCTDEKIFVATIDTVIALDSKTGRKMWSVQIEEEKWISSWHPTRELLVCEGTLYVGLRGPTVVCIDAESGRVLWRYKTLGTSFPSLRISGDRLLLVGNGLTCLEKKGLCPWM